ncbi:unnamed protein product [Prorocentrum cordatum]|uniref:Uncharacterized protein n=1 Tax=Prorocentrum cordatum TaxID=2364126 RepID=A0ABN9XTK3_9DINO|nr:unnamed protein product [Polarella glacialis]
MAVAASSASVFKSTVEQFVDSVFAAANDGGENPVILSPGASGLVVLFQAEGVEVSECAIEAVFQKNGWAPEKSLAKTELRALAGEFQTSFTAVLGDDAAPSGAEERSVVVETIASRLSRGTFPPVLPTDFQDAGEAAGAAQTWEAVLEVEYVELQSFIDAHWATYRETLPANPSVSEDTRRAEFMHDKFYDLCNDFQCARSLGERRFRHRYQGDVFLPVIAVASIGCELKRTDAAETVGGMTRDLIDALDAELWSKWGDAEKVAKYTKMSMQDLFRRFLHEEYFLSMRAVVQQSSLQQKKFTPKVLPGDVPGGDVDVLQAIVDRMVPEDGAAVEAVVEKLWQERLSAVLPSMRAFLPSAPSMDFWAETYYVVASEIVGKRAIAFTPKVLPEDVAGADVFALQSIADRMSADDGAAVEARVEEMWLQHVSALHPSMRAFLPKSPSEEFWTETYYVVAAEVLEGRVAARAPASMHAGTPAAASAGSGARTLAASLILKTARGGASSSPASKVRRTEGSRLSHGELGVEGVLGDLSVEVRAAAPRADAEEYIGSIAVYADRSVEGYFVYEGSALAHDDKPRPVGKGDAGKSPSKRKASAPEKTTMAMDVLVMDRTGPLILTSWDDAAKQFLAEVAAKQTGARRGGRPGQQQKPIIRVTNVRVSSLSPSDWNGAMVTPIRTLHTSSARSPLMPETKVMALVTASSPFMAPGRAYEVPAHGVCVDFFGLKDRLEAPFRGTFSGVVTSVQEMGATTAGSPKRAFCLVDPAGAFIQCCAVGHDAGSRALADGMRAVVYHGTGRGPIGSAPGMLHLLKDALLMPVAQVDVVPEPTIDIAIK